MSNFFVNNKIKKERLSICRKCSSYFKPTGNCLRCGCFMRIKASIGQMECPDKLWLKTSDIKKTDGIPKDLIKEAHDVWEGIKTGRALNHDYKKRAITLHNTIYHTGYNHGTNCSSCLRAVKEGIKKIIDEQNN